MFLLAAGIYSASGDWWATVGVAALLLLCLVGLVQFLWVARRRLSDGAE
jgi:hypothetical protein